MDRDIISENITDGLKILTATAPVGAQLFFGFTLQEWMYIASIIASIFYIFDKIPSMIRGVYGWIKRKSNSRSQCNDASAGESPR